MKPHRGLAALSLLVVAWPHLGVRSGSCARGTVLTGDDDRRRQNVPYVELHVAA